MDLNDYTALHLAICSNIPDSAEITDLLVKAGVDLDVRNKFGRSALEECVVNDNLSSLKVLVTAGARTEGTLRLARVKGRAEMVAYLESVSGESVEQQSREDEREALLQRLEELEREEREELEAKKKQTKKLLDKTKTDSKNHTRKIEMEIARLQVELDKFKKEEDQKITMLARKIRDLEFQLNKKKIIEKMRRVSVENDLVKCLECPVCLETFRNEVRSFPYSNSSQILTLPPLDLALQ